MLRVKGFWIVIAMVCLVAFIGCGPKFPLCKTDENCKDFKDNEGKLFCVNGTCQICGKDADCEAGKECKNNRCEIKPECLTDPDCKNGLVCRAQKCVPECTQNSDCGANMKCAANRCVPAAECAVDTDCPEGKMCQAEKCVLRPPPPPPCELAQIHFEFNKYDITPESKAILEKNAGCFKERKFTKLEIQGNCDERGTTEYNMTLGQKRADAAKKVLQNMGIKDAKTISYGKERPLCTDATEDCWAKNRRDDFVSK